MLGPGFVRSGAIDIATYRWGEAQAGRPHVLLAHGTGFCAAVWDDVAQALAADFAVIAIDRRGHGASSKPVDAYHFADFVDDCVRVIDALALEQAYAIGHSAGATDLLLASVQRPRAFRAIFALEPTAMDVTAPRLPLTAEQRAQLDGRLDVAARRRASFASFAEAFEHYRTRGVFRTWRPESLRAYVQHGFEPAEDGSVVLRCTPAIERAMLAHIFEAMEGSYAGDVRGNPFDRLRAITVPACIATTEGSQPIFKLMADIARSQIASASSHHFAGVGHTVAQIEPEAVSEAASRFWASA